MSVEGLLADLVAFPSVSNTSNVEISDYIERYLTAHGFQCERIDFSDAAGVAKSNVVARRGPVHGPNSGLAYFAHTDVVPAAGWQGPGGDPFRLTQQGSRYYGRGACDMKGSLACMLTAAAAVRAEAQDAPLWVVCTADEETGFAGARHVVEQSELYREIIRSQPAAIIGEPTRLEIVHAHKGILGVRVTSHGRAAHSSSREGRNANLAMIPFLVELRDVHQLAETNSRYHNSSFDPPTITVNFGVSDGCTAINITPEKSVAWASMRPMPGVPCRDLVERLRIKAAGLGLGFEEIPGCGPLWVDPHSPFVAEALRLAGKSASRTACYGTDGGIFTNIDKRIVCGPGDIAQAHTVDEFIEQDQLDHGIELYAKAIRHWCCRS